MSVLDESLTGLTHGSEVSVAITDFEVVVKDTCVVVVRVVVETVLVEVVVTVALLEVTILVAKTVLTDCERVTAARVVVALTVF